RWRPSASWRARCSTERPGSCKQSTGPIREDALVNLEYSAEYEDFRAQVRRFLAEHWSAGDAARQPDPDGMAAFAGAVPTDERATAFRLKAIERGYLYRHVPRRYGGGEQPPDPLKATLIAEEFRRARAPHEMVGQGPSMLVPTLLEHGTEAQKERFIPGTLLGKIRWCQGYSEPGAGRSAARISHGGRSTASSCWPGRSRSAAGPPSRIPWYGAGWWSSRRGSSRTSTRATASSP